MTINLQLPQKQTLKPTITVFGVGGGGGNAVSNMIEANLEGISFVVANTDAQALEGNLCKEHIQLGNDITQGLGAGSFPEVGKAAAEDSYSEILDHLQGSNMVFITAGLGGGTGTGAAPVVARLAKEQGILTVAVVTKPFHFEGSHRMKVAEQGLKELQEYVDTLIVVPNQNLFRVADKNTTFLDAFKLADEVLHSGVRGITDLMTMPGQINLDFSDVRSVMSEMGKAMMGTGEGEGDNRALEAAEAAIANPLLDNVSMKGARGVLINISGGKDMTLFEVDEAANRIREEVEGEANIIFGSALNDNLNGKMRVSVVATGIDEAGDERKHNPASTQATPPASTPQPIAPPTTELKHSSETFGSSLFEIPNATINNNLNTQESLNLDDQPTNTGFIPPAPVEPKNVALKDQEPLTVPVGFLEKSEKPTSNGFFGNIFGGAKRKEVNNSTESASRIEKKSAVTPNISEPEGSLSAQFSSIAQQQSPQAQTQNQPVAKPVEDLDIPAFLRRKK